MGSEENIEIRVPNCPSSGIITASNGLDPFYGSSWDPLVSLNQSGNFEISVVSQSQFTNPHFPIVPENQTIRGSSHIHHFPSDPVLVDMMPKVPAFGSGSFSEMISSFGLADCTQIAEIGSQPNFAHNNVAGTGKGSRNGAFPQENCLHSDDGPTGNSPNRVNKRKSMALSSPKNVEEEQQMDPCGETSEFPKEDNEKKQRIEQNATPNLRGKQAVKQAKDNANTGEPSKETYIHVRAKRGQATNSHSLAERVRRERISERMRMLQELVPGCNKITGKAVMLDEIINYVQSLQQQVEFLSMKLATVNPELNIDIERILSKDILNSRGNPAALGISPGLNTSHPFPGFSPGIFPPVPGTAPHYHPLPQNIWNNELQSILQMGYHSNPSISNSETNGLSKLEL